MVGWLADWTTLGWHGSPIAESSDHLKGKDGSGRAAIIHHVEKFVKTWYRLRAATWIQRKLHLQWGSTNPGPNQISSRASKSSLENLKQSDIFLGTETWEFCLLFTSRFVLTNIKRSPACTWLLCTSSSSPTTTIVTLASVSRVQTSTLFENVFCFGNGISSSLSTKTYSLVCIHLCLYLYVCMYVCMSVCMYVCMSVCLYVCMSVCLYVCMSVCLYVCMSVCLYVCMYVFMCVYKCVYKSVCVFAVCIYIYVYVYIYICICTCMHICIYVSMYLCVYVSMYLCICVCMYVCIYLCLYVCMYVFIYVCMYVCMYLFMSVCMYVCMYV